MQDSQTRCFLNKAKINEVFVSMQGEGTLIGVRQAFVRFAGCNLDCSYCDTDFSEKMACDYKYVLDFIKENAPIHSIVFTGGEPLLQAGFLRQLCDNLDKTITYLETNGTLPKMMEFLVDCIDIVAMDLKMPSVAGIAPQWERHRQFIDLLQNTDLDVILKVIISEDVLQDDLDTLQDILWNLKKDWPVVLQPVYEKTNRQLMDVIFGIQRRFLRIVKDVRVIPQVHRLLDID